MTKKKTERPEANNEGIYSPDSSSSIKEAFCGICGDKMNVQRNILGATSMTEGMAGRKHIHDRFECENNKETWHRQIKAIKKMIWQSPSKVMDNLLLEEIDGILKNRKPTKEHFWDF